MVDEQANGLSPPPWRLHDVALVALGLVVGAAMVASQTWSDTGLLDLRIYVGAANELRSGGSIYGFTDSTYHLGSTYPPLWSLLVLPLTFLDIHLVELLWTLAGELGWLLAFQRVAGRRSWSRTTVIVVWLVSLPSAPVWNTLNQGQISIIIWMLLLVDLGWDRRTSRGHGLATGAATALKLVPAGAVALLAWSGRWRTALVAASGAVGLTVASAALVPNDAREYWTHLVFDTGRVGALTDSQNNSLRAVLGHLADVGASEGVQIALWIALSAGLLVGLAGPAFRAAIDAGATVSAATILGCFLALVSPVSWTHHLVFLCFPLLLAVPHPARRDAKGWMRFAVLAILLVDPIGFGRLTATSLLRCAAMVTILCGAKRLVAYERALREIRAPSM